MRIDQFAGEVRRISQRPHPLAQQVMGSSHGFTWRLDEFAGQDTADVRAHLLQRAQQASSKSKFWKNVTYGLAGLTVAATAGAVGASQAGLAAGWVYGGFAIAGTAALTSLVTLAAASVDTPVKDPKSDPTIKRMDEWLDFMAHPQPPLFGHRPAPGQARVRDFTRAEIVEFAQQTAAVRQPCQEIVRDTTQRVLDRIEQQTGDTYSEIEASFKRSASGARRKARLAKAGTWLGWGLAAGSFGSLAFAGSHPALALGGLLLGLPAGVITSLTLFGKERDWDWQARNLDYSRELMDQFVDYLNDPLAAAQQNRAYVHELAAEHEDIPLEETYDWVEVGSVGLAKA
ncbi:MAG: hypothetical protein KC910_17965 [Candidatus Eremiobacteraeota bacterium]|nr:hypothetical protein [Candidatus Eremiobacteraeota bacterium]